MEKNTTNTPDGLAMKSDQPLLDSPHLLVVDDDPRLVELLQRYLCKQGYLVSTCGSAEEALELMGYIRFSMVILDIRMPGQDGIGLTETLRTMGENVPILLLTAESHIDQRLAGLGVGADDFLTKPFDTRELLARIAAILRRVQPQELHEGRILYFGDKSFHSNQMLLKQGKEPIALSGKEQAVLCELAAKPHTVINRYDLIERCGGEGSGRNIDAVIVRLRRKLEVTPSKPIFLQTVHGQGYVLRPDRLVEQ